MQNTIWSEESSQALLKSCIQVINLSAKYTLNNYSWYQPAKNLIFENTIYLMQQIELGRLKPPIPPISPSITKNWKLLIDTINFFMQQGPLPSKFSVNPYIQVFTEQIKNLMTLPQGVIQPENLIKQIQVALYSAKAGLKARALKETVNKQISDQNMYFNRILHKHKLVHCFFLEIPFVAATSIIPDLETDESESIFPQLLKKFFLNLHKDSALEKKLCDIQWRIVKGLDNVLIAHILVYIAGETEVHIGYLNNLWQQTCAKESSNINNATLHIHEPLAIYKEQAIAKKQWKDLIKNYHKSLEHYFYKSKKITYEWSPYTGNI